MSVAVTHLLPVVDRPTPLLDPSAVESEAGVSAGGTMMDVVTSPLMADREGAPFVGREAQLAELTGLLAVAEPQGSGTVLLGGDAGVGKTRLLLALRDEAVAAGRQVVVGHCVDFGDSTLPYLPFTEILGRLQADRPDDVERLTGAYPAIGRLLPRQRVRATHAPTGDEGPVGAGPVSPSATSGRGGPTCSPGSTRCSRSWPPAGHCSSWSRTPTGPTSPAAS